ncbi:MAG TPA: plastocyanin/azurin family copper-binding protein [Dehalococcoidia bacterium]|nr:plastocyanin/azurin family copper-binding protein [Dehalococcoidia bacterium]
MRRLGVLRPIGFAVLAVLLAGAAALGGETHVKTASAANTINLFAGGGQGTISDESFRPNSVTIVAGDTVKWTNPYGEIHTVTFVNGQTLPDLILNGDINPAIAAPSGPTTFDATKLSNSGLMEEGGVYSMTFNTPGIYQYLCVIHPGMVGSVQVVPAGNTGASSPANVSAQAKAQLDAAVAAGNASVAATHPTSAKNADGTTTYTNLIPASVGQVDLFQFVDPSVNVKVGDTVKWINNTEVPHTVTFGIQNAGPSFQGPFVPTTAPVGTTYDGTGLINSGIYSAGFPGSVGNSFSVTFTKPGTYAYICLLHSDLGMAGVVNVSAASTSGGGGGATITPPATGDAGLLGQSSGSLMMFAGFAMLILSIGAGVFGFARKNA